MLEFLRSIKLGIYRQERKILWAFLKIKLIKSVLFVVGGRDQRQVQLYESDILTGREASIIVDFIAQSSCI